MENPRHWRLKKQRYRLIGEECPKCEAKIFPPRVICPECDTWIRGGQKPEETEEIALLVESRAGVEPA